MNRIRLPGEILHSLQHCRYSRCLKIRSKSVWCDSTKKAMVNTSTLRLRGVRSSGSGSHLLPASPPPPKSPIIRSLNAERVSDRFPTLIFTLEDRRDCCAEIARFNREGRCVGSCCLWSGFHCSPSEDTLSLLCDLPLDTTISLTPTRTHEITGKRDGDDRQRRPGAARGDFAAGHRTAPEHGVRKARRPRDPG